MVHPASVLIIDTSSDSRAVLRTALERKGLHTLEAPDAAHGLAMARRYQPDLIVLDLEDEDQGVGTATTDFRSAVKCQSIPLVVLGRAAKRLPSPDRDQFVAKPYHYAPLIHKIEQLLKAVAEAAEH